jgi:hypothetical protein
MYNAGVHQARRSAAYMRRRQASRGRAAMIVALCLITLTLSTGAPSTGAQTVRSHAAASSPVGRYKVIVEGFSVSAQTWDNVLQSDGKGDETFLSAKVAYLDSKGKAVAPESSFKSQTMGDINGWNGRVQAGSASDRGGIISGDTFPSPLDLTATPTGTSSTFTPPFTLWEGDLIQGKEAVVITPSLWEWDGSGDVFGGWLAWAQTALPKIAASVGTFIGGGTASDTIKKATELGLGVLTVFNDPSFVGVPGDRPIGTTKAADGKSFIFDQQVVLLNYDRAEALLRQQINGVSGLIALNFQDDPTLTGDYTLYLRVVSVEQKPDVTPPRVTVLRPNVKSGRATLRWQADDPYVEGAKTSGVDSFDLSVRKSGRWKLLLDHTDDTTHLIKGKHGVTVVYRVRARDDARNTSGWSQPRSVRLP